MVRKTIVSVTLDDKCISRLQKYAEQRHGGNRSEAIRAMIMNTVGMTLDDFDHPYPVGVRNWKGTGKCNPKHPGGVCPHCWGENVRVELVKDIGNRSRVVVTPLEGSQ